MLILYFENMCNIILNKLFITSSYKQLSADIKIKNITLISVLLTPRSRRPGPGHPELFYNLILVKNMIKYMIFQF